ncbi:hypothetical protein L593_09690 [Salinarchaeum sp. Harcht-Bsk1]|uniref:DUF4129 domain-containing protein n=1 Tax=Salinarchaeum sp. Harcht-Bsk1 TaxID=1333523 RepID=UPI0003423426|nr:DUF4129 domain-containing protein [Salinarchaeum sp. Harcht-Bsk1]AGN01883.1 hypothetical protein L593_09690 [Salinarchaeum sp. Harcht-Bsk1]
MQTRRLRAGLVLLLAVVALGAAGAAVDSGRSGGGSTGLGEGSGSGAGSGADGLPSISPEFNPFFDGGILAAAIGVLAVVGLVAALVGGTLLLLEKDWDELKEYLFSAGIKVGVFALVGIGFYLLMQLFDGLPDGGGSTGLGGGSEDVEAAGEAASSTGLQLPTVVGIVVVAAILLFIVVTTLGGGSEEDGEAVAATPDPEESPGGIGTATPTSTTVGRPPADNEIYRAWLALAEEANADARRETPAEVADRAVAAGVDEAATREITSLFERVRYGGVEPDEATEQRAERALARMAGDR